MSVSIAERRKRVPFVPNEKSMDKAVTPGQDLELDEFFEAWPVPLSVIAERLRLSGANITRDGLLDLRDSDNPLKNERFRGFMAFIITQIMSDISKTKINDEHTRSVEG